jgi:RND family efflux transporter MFP subunit
MLYSKRDSLMRHIDKTNMQLAEINERIAELDSTARFYTVSAHIVEPGLFEHFVEVYGTVGSEKNTILFPETGGVITAISVKPGQPVSRGQILIQLDGSLLLSSISEVKTQLELATSVFEKQKRLWEQKVGSEIQYLQAKNNKESLESRLRTLEKQYSQTMVRAPFDGVVDEIFPKVGQLVGPQTQLIRLVNLDNIYIEGEISETYSGLIQPGYVARVRIPATDSVLEARVTSVAKFINPTNRTFKVRLELLDKQIRLVPNALVSIMIKDYENPAALIIPVRLIQQDPEGNDFVITLEKTGQTIGVARKKVIKPGRSYRNMAEVLSGIEPGALLVDKGARNVKDGQKVRIMDALSALE